MARMTSINGKVLNWAREISNISTEDAGKRVNKDGTVILSWEQEEDYPTYGQLEKLGELYKKPIAVFFFPNIPEVNSIKTSCRTINEAVFNTISTKVIRLMNEARVMQLNLLDLNKGYNPDLHNLIKLRGIKNSRSIRDAATETRKILEISLDKQKEMKKIDEALEFWRDIMRINGIYVFKEAFHDDSISGFCLYDEQFPIIYINNSMSFSRQIFTLFHELFHLLNDTSGIDKLEDDYLSLLETDKRDVEVMCNQFAAEFLVPKDDFIKSINGLNINDATISNLANTYCVSREVIMRKLLDLGKISQITYNERRIEYIEEAKRSKNESNGGNFYNTMISYLGYGYLHLVFTQYKEKRIDIFNVAEYTKLKVGQVSTLEKKWGWRIKR